MLSLGIKEAVINDFADYAVSFTLAGAASTAELGDKMHIQGFGTFTGANLVAGKSSAARKVDAVKEVSEVYFTNDGLVGGTAIVPGDGLTGLEQIWTVQVFVRTTRYQSEFANDFIKQGRPIVIEVVGDGTKTLSALVIEALDARNARFAIGEATPFTYVDLGAGKGITFTVSHQSLHIEKTFIRAKAAFLDTSLPVGVTVEGTEGQGNGSQIEESVRMGFGENINPYGIKAGTNVSVGGAYSELFWKVSVGVTEKVGFLLDGAPLSRQVSFNVFANENGNLAASGPIDRILTFLLTNGGIAVAGAAAAQLGVYLADGTNATNTAGTVAEAVTDFIA